MGLGGGQRTRSWKKRTGWEAKVRGKPLSDGRTSEARQHSTATLRGAAAEEEVRCQKTENSPVGRRLCSAARASGWGDPGDPGAPGLDDPREEGGLLREREGVRHAPRAQLQRRREVGPGARQLPRVHRDRKLRARRAEEDLWEGPVGCSDAAPGVCGWVSQAQTGRTRPAEVTERVRGLVTRDVHPEHPVPLPGRARGGGDGQVRLTGASGRERAGPSRD